MSGTHELLVLATVAVGITAMALAYRRSRDPFHPLLLACPMALFIYAGMPWMLREHETLTWFVPPEGLERAQAIFLLLFAAFCAAALVASRDARWRPGTAAPELSPHAARRVLVSAIAMGTAGLMAWVVLIVGEGGLAQVYDQPHGGDVLHPSGWVRESTRLALVGTLLTLAASRAWWSVLIAFAFAAPHLVHALLGTRRGPAFVTAVFLLLGLYVFARRRPRLLASLAAGAALGLLLLFLLANRWRFYYGSETPITFDLTDSIAFYPNPGNEYVVAAGLVTAADRTETFGWGVSYAEQLFLRPIPKAVLPEKYDLLEEQTVGAADIGSTLGWTPWPGWVPTLFAHLYIEFGWLALAASALLGWAYGWAWRRSVESPRVGWLALQVVMTAGLLHLVAQGFWAMAVPFLLMFAPAWLALKLAIATPFRGSSTPRRVPLGPHLEAAAEGP